MRGRVVNIEDRRELVEAETEGRVLGALLEASETDFGRRVIADILAEVKPEDFAGPGHSDVLSAVRRLAASNVPVNVATVARDLEDRNKLKACGGAAALVAMQEGAVGAVASGPHFARRVATLARRRSLRTEAASVAKDAGQRLDDPGFASELLARLLRADTGPRTAEVLDGVEWMGRAWKALETRHESKEAPGIAVGLGYFDSSGGLERSELTVIAGRPGDGKTALGLRLAVGAAGRGAETLVVSVEMAAEDLALRALAGQGGVLGDRVRDPRRLEPGDFVSLSRAATHLGPALDHIRVTAPEPDASHVDALLEMMRREHAIRPLDLVIVDYAQLVRAPGRTREEEVAKVSRALKSFAKGTGAAVVALAQLNREIERRADPIPQLSDLRDSGQLEQDSGTVIVLSRFERLEGGGTEEHQDQRFVYVLKRRHGEARTAFPLRFIADRGPWFEDVESVGRVR